MSGTRHELTSFGPVPDWWSGAFFRRQVELRRKIKGICDAAPKLGFPGFTQASIVISCSHYEAGEVQVALQHMVSDGVIFVNTDGRYSVAKEEGRQ